MFGKKSKYNKIDSLIAASHQFSGDFKFNGVTRVEGNITGKVSSTDESGTLIICETALIEGDIHAAYVIVNGKVNGNIYATKLLTLESKAQIKGDLFYNLLEVHSGADIEGKLVKKVPETIKEPVLTKTKNEDDTLFHQRGAGIKTV